MTDVPTPPLREVVARLAALVALAVEQPSAAQELRGAAKGVVDAARAGGVTFTLQDGVLRADGEVVDAPVLRDRFGTYGIEELGITPRASQADLFDLARILAAHPGDGDPVARFSSRAAVLDARTIPRRLRARLEPQAEAVPLLPPAPPKRPSKQTPALTRSVTPEMTPAVAEAQPTDGVDADATGGGAAPPAPRRTPRELRPPPEPAVAEPRDAPVRLMHPLAIPVTTNPALATAITLLTHADDPKRLTHALEQTVAFCDLAFRQGRHDDLIEGVAALVAIEFTQLERDASDAQRQAFNHAVRRLARPVLLRQLATLRHARAADPVARERLQQALYRFGMDGAEAMLDACVSATDAATLDTCVEALRALPRAHEALQVLLTQPNELVVRQAVGVLGALRDAASAAALDRLIDHPDARTRRDVVSAIARFEGEDAFASLALALGDESPMVRLRAVTALRARREPRIVALLEPLLRAEPERDVLYAAVEAIGAIGSPEAVQLLIAIAQGNGTGPLRDTSGLRIQACIALVAIRTPQSMAAVQVLRDDRDREVRQASMRLVAHAKRRPTTAQTAIVSP